MLLKGY